VNRVLRRLEACYSQQPKDEKGVIGEKSEGLAGSNGRKKRKVARGSKRQLKRAPSGETTLSLKYLTSAKKKGGSCGGVAKMNQRSLEKRGLRGKRNRLRGSRLKTPRRLLQEAETKRDSGTAKKRLKPSREENDQKKEEMSQKIQTEGRKMESTDPGLKEQETKKKSSKQSGPGRKGENFLSKRKMPKKSRNKKELSRRRKTPSPRKGSGPYSAKFHTGVGWQLSVT